MTRKLYIMESIKNVIGILCMHDDNKGSVNVSLDLKFGSKPTEDWFEN